jgi:hypothetical protein
LWVLVFFYGHHSFFATSHETFRNFIICCCTSITLFTLFSSSRHRIPILLILVFLSNFSSICDTRLLLGPMIHLNLIWSAIVIPRNITGGPDPLTANCTSKSFFLLSCFLLHRIDSLCFSCSIRGSLFANLLKQSLSSLKLECVLGLTDHSLESPHIIHPA